MKRYLLIKMERYPLFQTRIGQTGTEVLPLEAYVKKRCGDDNIDHHQDSRH